MAQIEEPENQMKILTIQNTHFKQSTLRLVMDRGLYI